MSKNTDKWVPHVFIKEGETEPRVTARTNRHNRVHYVFEKTDRPLRLADAFEAATAFANRLSADETPSHFFPDRIKKENMPKGRFVSEVEIKADIDLRKKQQADLGKLRAALKEGTATDAQRKEYAQLEKTLLGHLIRQP